jgi:NTP pyrophosphatase (non-canonical NTP hydrolase)
MITIQKQHREMVLALKKSGQEILDTLTPAKIDLVHMAMGVSGEAGELSDAIKKFVIYNKEIDRENVIEELGDLEFFLEGVRGLMGITREETLTHNMEKLLKGDKARYKLGKYTDAQAHNRQDKQ